MEGGAGDDDHLLLAAREGAGLLAETLLHAREADVRCTSRSRLMPALSVRA